MRQVHRVKRDRVQGTVLPKDRWQGGTFIEADGTELEVQFDGHRDGPTLLGERPYGSPPHDRTIGTRW